MTTTGSGPGDGAARPSAGAACDAEGVELRDAPPVAGADVIRLVLPAEPEYGRIARVAASSLALRLGLTFADIEDLRIAVDEAIILLLRPEGAPGQITLEFTVEPHVLVIDATTTAGRDQHWLDTGALGRFEEIVADTIDEHDVDPDNRHVHLVKRY
jgi:hypothetical protein